VTADLAPPGVVTLTTLEEIDALRSEWNALEARTPEATGFQSFAWCRGWVAASLAAGRPAQPRIVVVREGGRLVMLWPLQIETLLGAYVARWLGEPMTQYGDILAEPGEGRERWRRAVESEFARWSDVDLFAYARLREDSAFCACGAQAQPVGEALAAPYVDLIDAREGRRHKSVERRMKRLAEFGALHVEEIAAPVRREQNAAAALEMKRRWLADKGVVSVGLSNAVTERFLNRLAYEGALRVHALWVGDTLAAVDVGPVGGGVYRSLLGSYNLDMAEGSPGQALTQQLLARCAGNGLARYDFLAPADDYKLIWASGVTQIVANYTAVTARGRAAAFVLAQLRPLAKKAARRLGAAARVIYAHINGETPSRSAAGGRKRRTQPRGVPSWRVMH
jgi:CelD/BcsL family acetyltransferase involved in cellulose biosynthesis